MKDDRSGEGSGGHAVAIRERRTLPENPFVMALAAASPPTAAMSTLWVESVRQRRNERMEEFINQLAQDVHQLGSRLDEAEREKVGERLSDDRVSDHTAAVLEVAAVEGDESKRRYLRRFLLGFAEGDAPDWTLADIYLAWLRELQGAHLVILDLVVTRQIDLADDLLGALGQGHSRPEDVTIHACSRELNLGQALTEVLIHDLASRGLLAVRSEAPTGKDRSARLVATTAGRGFMKSLGVRNSGVA